MNRLYAHLAFAGLALTATMPSTAWTQLRRSAAPSDGVAPAVGIPRDSRHPYVGLWRGTRVMPIGRNEIGLRLTVDKEKYSGEIIHPDGSTAPQMKIVADANGLTWESPNSGGGTWVYHVRLVGPDSIAGTLVLRDAPPNFNPVPKGTLELKRQAAPSSREK